MFKKVVIVGTGLIGGSLGLAIKKKHLAKEIAGISRRKESLLLAKKIKAIDSGSQDIDLVAGADLVIFACPVNVILALAPKIAKKISAGCIVTDVGSTKEVIVKKLDALFAHYAGSHPMAGSEKRGIRHAKNDLFEGSLCIVTPTKKTNPKALAVIKKMWTTLGCRLVTMTAARHDKTLSFISHLPHALAFSLITSVPKEFLGFASGGLKDTTRIAASDAELWCDIFLSNRQNLLQSMKTFESAFGCFKKALQDKDAKRLSSIMQQAKRTRDNLD